MQGEVLNTLNIKIDGKLKRVKGGEVRERLQANLLGEIKVLRQGRTREANPLLQIFELSVKWCQMATRRFLGPGLLIRFTCLPHN